VLIYAVTAVAAGAALQSATGFGFSVIAAPLVFAAVGPPEAVGVLLVLGMEVNLLTLLTERRRPRPRTREAVTILAWALPGALAGVAALRALDPVALQVAVSAGVLATLGARRFGSGHHVPRWAAPAAGLAAGGLTTSTSTAGPPMLVYLLGRGVEPEQVRDTLTVCFVGLGLIGAAALWVTGTDAVPDASTIAWLVPVVAAGHILGRPVFARLASGGRYEPVVTGVLLVSVVAGLAGALG
jgi:uncharacterized protein